MAFLLVNEFVFADLKYNPIELSFCTDKQRYCEGEKITFHHHYQYVQGKNLSGFTSTYSKHLTKAFLLKCIRQSKQHHAA